jgi:capsular polysaccharide export protein
VREENPGAYVVYKPHPDLIARNRPGDTGEDVANTLSDEVLAQANIHDCLHSVDEVHTMTSLAGFEALMRGKRVVTYGQPFYAGWGLTTDRAPLARRTRKLSLDELVAGTLILYPRYFDWKSGHFCDCEAIIDRLVEQRSNVRSRGPVDLAPGWGRRIRKARHLVEGWLRTA